MFDPQTGIVTPVIWRPEGNAFRKPHRDGLLTVPEAAPPCVWVHAGGAPFDRTRR
jgi:hypothetical protein